MLAAPLPDDSLERYLTLTLFSPISNVINSRNVQSLYERDPSPRKIHLPHIHINGAKILKGIKKWLPKIAKTIVKIGSMVLREEENGVVLAREPDLDEMDEVVARGHGNPNGSPKTKPSIVGKVGNRPKQSSGRSRSPGLGSLFSDSFQELKHPDEREVNGAEVLRRMLEELGIETRDVDWELDDLE